MTPVMTFSESGEEKTVAVSATCPYCSTKTTIQVPASAHENWFIKGYHIQDALHMLSDTQRETLITGECEKCQEKTFAGEDEMEEYG